MVDATIHTVVSIAGPVTVQVTRWNSSLVSWDAIEERNWSLQTKMLNDSTEEVRLTTAITVMVAVSIENKHAPSLTNGSTNGWSSAAKITRPTDDIEDVTESLGSWASRARRRRSCSLLLLLVLGTPTRKGEVRIITLKCPFELIISRT
jgi:hypothetical protein